MYCVKCGLQLPDDAVFCIKCGTRQNITTTTDNNAQSDAVTKALKCPSCGAPISPKFGEMVISCEYCGGSVALENNGWQNVEKHTMLPIAISEREQIIGILKKMMDKGFLHRHLQESSNLEELNLSMIPYWIIPASAKTNLTAVDVAAEVGSIATTAALAGLMGGAFGGSSRRGFGGGMMGGMLMGGMLGSGGMMSSGNAIRAYTIDSSYNCPVIALKALTSYQPNEYEFAMDKRIDFDSKKIQKSVKILNGDINEDAAKNQAKTIVDLIQSQKAHSQYHMIRQIETQVEVAKGELMHVPIWFARYDHKGKKIILLVDASSGVLINSIGL